MIRGLLSDASRMSWQRKPSHIIEDHDIQSISNIPLLECQRLCTDFQPECRSVDYFPSTSLCNLNDVAFGDEGFYSLFPSRGDYYSFCELGKLIDSIQTRNGNLIIIVPKYAL